MPSYVRVAPNVPSLTGVRSGAALNTFDYRVPDRLQGVVGAGHLIVVPFGGRTVQGVVVRVLDTPAVAETKDIIKLVDPEPVMTVSQIALAEWLAESTLSSIPAIIGLFLPPGLNQQVDTLFSLRRDAGNAPAADSMTGREPSKGPSRKSNIESRLLRLLRERGALRGRQIDRALPRVEWRPTAQYLVRRGHISAQSVLPPASVRAKFVRTAQLAVAPEIAESRTLSLGSTAASQARRESALRFLIRRPEAVNVSWVYAESGCNLSDLQELAERELITLHEEENWRDPLAQKDGSRNLSRLRLPPELTNEQARAWQPIEDAIRGTHDLPTSSSFLLHGVTGSGKTEIYLRAVAEVLRAGRQAIVLVPEIALTPQTIDRFLARFPAQVGLVHSRLSEGERYDTWRRARAGSLQVIVGPRSALFAPLSRIGLLIIDECHDASYHQAEPPFYSAINAAREYARISGAVCVMGSATPSVVQSYQAQVGECVRLELNERVATGSEIEPAPVIDMPPVRIVDMRDELKAGNRGCFSRELQSALAEVLRRREQAILFLNRRGTATHVFCRNCGYVIRCPRCETPLTYHTAGAEKLVCHRCGYERNMPKKCRECGSPDFRAYGLGTERVEAEVMRLWPSARTLRWDYETTREKGAHELILHHFADGKADVLIGTQMLAKGLDLPHVTLVGIVLADVGLFLPDPLAAERSFQVLTQVAGRAGRSRQGGKAVLQTFAPDHYAIQAAARHDVNGFYAVELEQRRRLGYPPFSRLLRLEFRNHDPVEAEGEARQVAEWLRSRLSMAGRVNTSMIGPAPCFFSKLGGRYRWQIVVRGGEFASLVEGRRLENWRIEVDPISLL